MQINKLSFISVMEQSSVCLDYFKFKSLSLKVYDSKFNNWTF
jgi:hypothetical protein